MSFRSQVKKFIPRDMFRKIEPYGHTAEAVMWNIKNGFPGRGLKIIGVTGTNGKTSTAFLIHKMLVESGINAGLMTTVAYGVSNDIQPQVEHMTTVSVPLLHRRLKQMKAAGADWIVLEVTSHALAQGRTWGIPFDIAVLTNLTHEHLDYHGSFENYRDAKKKLFTMTNKNKKGLRTGVINGDDSSAAVFAEEMTHSLIYGIEQGDLIAKKLKLTPGGSRFVAQINDEEMHIECHLPGTFNVYNSLAAVGVGHVIGLSKEQIEKGIAALKGVEGRMTTIDEGQNFEVIVDYAHTPDSFEKLFKDLKPVVKGKLIVMFGSAGRRDEAKRAVQGRLAGDFADEVVITEEDDRDMDGLEIMDQIAAGAESAGKERDKDLFLVHDRSEAIQFAINRAETGDIVLLLGKGHEKDILRNGPRAAELRHLQQDDHNPERVVEYPWDEIATTRQTLKNRT
jgi:UDP-N-acetylmuramoyl-L-alanyl-D-glutamate--2,6-diaminopimelate ligase